MLFVLGSIFPASAVAQSELQESRSISYSKKKLEPVVLQLLWTHQFEYAGFYAAKELGFYQEEGLEVEIRPLSPGQNPVDEVVSGRAHYGISNSELILARTMGQPVVMLANLFKHSPLVVLARRDTGIRHPKDLHGRKLMTSDLDLSSAEINYMMSREQVDLNQIQRIDHNYSVTPLVYGSVDAMTAYITNQPFQLQEKGIDYVVIDPANYGADFYSNTLFTRDSEIKNNPERVRAFRRASMRGWRYALDHPKAVVDIISRKYSPNKSQPALMYEAREIQKLIASDVYPLGSVDISRVERLIQIYRESGQLGEIPDLMDFIWPEALEEHNTVNPESLALNLSATEEAFLNELSVIRMCVTPDWMPYEGLDDKGRHTGIAADVMALLSESLGKPFKLIETADWTETLMAVKQRRCDIISAAASTLERQRYLSFTKNYLSFPNVVITRKEQSFINNMTDMNGRRVGVVKDFYQAGVLEDRFPDIEAVLVNSVTEGLELVSKGQLDGFVGAIASTGYYIRTNGYSNLHIAGHFPEDIKQAVAIRSDWPLLLTAFEKAVNNINPTDLQAILQRWVGIKIESKINYTLIWQLAFIAIVILSVVLLANRKLAKLNLSLTEEIDQRSKAEWALKELNLELEQKNQRLEELSTTDSLTSLRNRYYVENSLENALLTANIRRESLSILLLDLDHFKQVNDSYGHSVGDDVLVLFSRLLKQHLKPKQIAGRWGGEEFLVILPRANKEMAYVVAEDLRRKVEAYSFPDVKHITVSIGLAETQMDESPNFLIHRADNALYQAKSIGRNCVVIAEPEALSIE